MNRYIAAIDLGLVHDRAVATIVHSSGQDVYLDRMDVWQGRRDAPVQLSEIEAWVTDALSNFKVAQLVLDPWQLEALAQKFERRTEVIRFGFGGGNHFKLAENLRTLILNKRLKIYKDAGKIALPNGSTEDFIDEISQLIVVEKGNFQYRLDHLPDKFSDRTISLAMACFACVQLDKLLNPNAILGELTKKKPLMEEDELSYQDVKKVSMYGTYQPRPVVNGDELNLQDYKTVEEAAYAVNHVYRLVGRYAVNTLDYGVPPLERQEQIKKDMEAALTARGLYPLPPKPQPQTAKDKK